MSEFDRLRLQIVEHPHLPEGRWVFPTPTITQRPLEFIRVHAINSMGQDTWIDNYKKSSSTPDRIAKLSVSAMFNRILNGPDSVLKSELVERGVREMMARGVNVPDDLVQPSIEAELAFLAPKHHQIIAPGEVRNIGQVDASNTRLNYLAGQGYAVRLTDIVMAGTPDKMMERTARRIAGVLDVDFNAQARDASDQRKEEFIKRLIYETSEKTPGVRLDDLGDTPMNRFKEQWLEGAVPALELILRYNHLPRIMIDQLLPVIRGEAQIRTRTSPFVHTSPANEIWRFPRKLIVADATVDNPMTVAQTIDRGLAF